MSPSSLKRVPRTPPESGIYRLSGSLEGITPGKRIVRELTLTNLPPDADALAAITAFTDVETLRIERVAHAALTPLAELPLRSLTILGLEAVGLGQELTTVRSNASDPDRVAPALAAYLGLDHVYVAPRVQHDAAPSAWEIRAPGDDGAGSWRTYGSLADATAGEYGETEGEALAGIVARLRSTDATLLDRLDFDPESSGTGVGAAKREDLVRFLVAVGVRRA